MTDIRRNNSGYYDPTAFEAIKNVIKNERKTSKMKMKKGEIWEVQAGSGQFKNVVILNANNDLAQVIPINGHGNEYCIEINCQGISFADPRKIQHIFSDKFVNYIRTLKDDEYNIIMDAVAEILGIKTSYEEAVEPLHLLPETLENDNSEELIKAKAERDVFKNLYEKLLADVMKG